MCTICRSPSPVLCPVPALHLSPVLFAKENDFICTSLDDEVISIHAYFAAVWGQTQLRLLLEAVSGICVSRNTHAWRVGWDVVLLSPEEKLRRHCHGTQHHCSYLPGSDGPFGIQSPPKKGPETRLELGALSPLSCIFLMPQGTLCSNSFFHTLSLEADVISLLQNFIGNAAREQCWQLGSPSTAIASLNSSALCWDHSCENLAGILSDANCWIEGLGASEPFLALDPAL